MAFQNIERSKILSAIKGDSESKKLLQEILDCAGPGAIWRRDPNPTANGGWDLSWPKGNQIVLKAQKSYIENIIKKYKADAVALGKDVSKPTITLQVGQQKIQFGQTSATTDASGKKISEATMTRMQELGSALIFKRSIHDNITFKSPKDILDDKETMDGLLKIWTSVGKTSEVGQDWIENFYKQNKTLLSKIGKPTFTEFNREGGFMDWVSKLVKDQYGISKKDNWNPADIWLIQNETKWKKVITDAVSPNGYRGRRSQTIEELNAIFRTLFKSRQIFGVSLKKISGDEARYEEVNVRSSFFKDIEAMTFKVDKIQCKCGRKNNGFETQDSRMIVKDGVKEYNFQIKANDSTKMSGLKYEPTAKGAGAARLGKATVELVVRLLNDNGFTFSKESSAYPQNADEFLAEETKYKKMFGDLFRRGVDFGSAENADAMYDIFLSVFATQPHVANSKLQQLTFFHLITSLKPDELDEFGTDMVFLAMKAGRRYGPFAKLY